MVKVEFDVEKTDRYGRLLAYLYPEDGGMFNEILLREGYAQVATFPPNVRYVDRFVAAQQEARTAGRGLWGLSADQLSQQTDRGNGIGGTGCAQKSVQPKTSSQNKSSANSCPPGSPIKGNQSGIYHVPGGQFYGATNPEECFVSEADAQAAGYRASKR